MNKVRKITSLSLVLILSILGHSSLNGAFFENIKSNFDALKESINAGSRAREAATKAQQHLYSAASSGDGAGIEAALKENTDVNTPNVYDNNNTALHYAAQNDQTGSITTLLKHGANVNTPDKYGQTPLFKVLNDRKYKAANALIEGGADPNIPNRLGWTPLHLAVKYDYLDDNLDLIKKLLAKGANPMAEANTGHQYKLTPMDMARRSQRDLRGTFKAVRFTTGLRMEQAKAARQRTNQLIKLLEEAAKKHEAEKVIT